MSPSKRSRSWRSVALVAILPIAAAVAGVWLTWVDRSEPKEGPASPTHRSWFRTENEHLSRLQDWFEPVLEANRKEFVGRTGWVEGFGAGDVYPQIWLRDSATIIPASRFFYTAPPLRTWLEEHLAHQAPDGQLFDWIAPAPVSYFLPFAPRARTIYRSTGGASDTPLEISVDRNSIESDQESSAVSAAYRVFQITGETDWLMKSVNGRPLIERLEDALAYLLERKLEPDYGLLVSGFAADWGDVSPIYPDQRVIYLDEHTPLVVGLYTNCRFFEAARQLSEMLVALGRQERASFWRARAEAIKAAVNEHLWQSDRGFYRMHRVVTPSLTRGWPDDSNIFPMGGNGLAALYGVADDEQARRLFEVARGRQETYGVSTISGSLLPPYPEGFFKHSLMQEPYHYQNGGQWDWFGGRFVLAEFERGEADWAERHLIEIAEKAAANQGLFEWHNREGEGGGSPNYAGSAGALAEACFRGLFGIYLGAKELQMKVRLGETSGEIGLQEPVTETYLHYRYRYDPARGEVRLDYESNHPEEGRLSILLPSSRLPRTLWVDGVTRSFVTDTVGRDVYVTLTTDWRPHELRLELN